VKNKQEIKNHMFGKKGKDNPNFGKKRLYTPRPNMKGKLSGKKNPSSKVWRIISPNKEVFECNDMVKFCKDNKLNYYSFVTNKKWHLWECEIMEDKT